VVWKWLRIGGLEVGAKMVCVGTGGCRCIVCCLWRRCMLIVCAWWALDSRALNIDSPLLPLHACHQRHDRDSSLSLLKSDAALNTNNAAIWEIDVMAIALWIKTDPMAIMCAHVELRA